MNMIKKIALTASAMLFVLAQIFSCYVIFSGYQEKMEMLRETEGKVFAKACSYFLRDLAGLEEQAAMQDYAVTYCFRKHMMQGCALYQGERELFNSSPYQFDVANVDFEVGEYPCASRRETVKGHSLLIFYQKYEQYGHQGYALFYVRDVTSVFKKSARLAVQQLAVAFVISVLMAVLLVVLVRKITRPLEAANEAQRQLIGSMSHELKTPLTAIKGYSETLLSVTLSAEQKEKALCYINRESGRLSRLSEKMMELTKLYDPQCKVTLQNVPVELLFERVERSVSHRLSEKEISIVREGEYQGRAKRLDEDLAVSFLLNLVNNSIMASDDHSRIYLGADEHSLWVRDEGCGIPKSELDKVRNAFYRVDHSRSRKSGNMGLGLTLCEQIAAAHHAQMQIESKPGCGTKVTLFTNDLQSDEYLKKETW